MRTGFEEVLVARFRDPTRSVRAELPRSEGGFQPFDGLPGERIIVMPDGIVDENAASRRRIPFDEIEKGLAAYLVGQRDFLIRQYRDGTVQEAVAYVIAERSVPAAVVSRISRVIPDVFEPRLVVATEARWRPVPASAPTWVKDAIARGHADRSQARQILRDGITRASGSCQAVTERFNPENAKGSDIARYLLENIPDDIASCGCNGLDVEALDALLIQMVAVAEVRGWLPLAPMTLGERASTVELAAALERAKPARRRSKLASAAAAPAPVASGPPAAPATGDGQAAAENGTAEPKPPRLRRGASNPQMRLGDIEVTGDRPQHLVRRRIRRQMRHLYQCYTKRLRARRRLSGRVNASFRVTAAGKSKDVTADGMDKKVSRCIVKALRRVSLPAAEGAPDAQVEVWFDFHWHERE